MDCGMSEELCGVDLGDKRLNRRLVKVAESLGCKPTESICAATGNFHDCKAAYRLFANSKVSPEKILQPHIEKSLQRARESTESLLIIHDTTELSYGKFKSIKNLGVLRKAPGMKQGLNGLLLHNSLCVSESGVPLGMMRQTFFNREDYLKARGQLERNVPGVHKNFSVEKKASWRWIDHLENSHATCSELEKEIIHVADRESDIYEYLQVAQDLEAKYVIRSMTNRRIEKESSPIKTSTLEVELQSSLPLGKTILEIQTNEGKIERHEMAVKAIKVPLYIPQRNIPSARIGPLKQLEVQVVEVKSFKDPSLKWRLITNLDCNSFDQAMRVVNIYRQRWTIESYHRALKSGYCIESARLSSRFLQKRQKYYPFQSIDEVLENKTSLQEKQS